MNGASPLTLPLSLKGRGDVISASAKTFLIERRLCRAFPLPLRERDRVRGSYEDAA